MGHRGRLRGPVERAVTRREPSLVARTAHKHGRLPGLRHRIYIRCDETETVPRNYRLAVPSNLSGGEQAMIEIRHKETGQALYEVTGDTLAGARLRGLKLRGADLRGRDLGAADLGRSDLSGADLEGASLARARGVATTHWV